MFITDNNPDVSTVRSFLEEATVMKRFQHPAILELTAIVFKENLPYVLTPYMENGDLKSYLIKYGSVSYIIAVDEITLWLRTIFHAQIFTCDDKDA